MASVLVAKTYAQAPGLDISERHLRTGTEVVDPSLIELTRRRIFGAVAAVPRRR